MNIDPVYWKRIGYVSIENDLGGWDSYDGLDFRFKATMVGDFYPTFNVSILGLSLVDVKRLTVLNPYDSISRGRRLRVYAGYEKDGIANPLVEGMIFEAIPTNPPEMWLNIKCLSTAPLFGKNMSIDIYGKTCKELFQRLAEKIGIDCKWDVRRKVTMPGSESETGNFSFSANGVAAKFPQMFSDKFSIMLYYTKGILVATDKKGWMNSPRNTHEISADTGMLGFSNVTFCGCNVKTRLDDSVDIMDWIDVKSKIVGVASAKYFVVRKTHAGHLRGDEWTTTLEGIKEGARAI